MQRSAQLVLTGILSAAGFLALSHRVGSQNSPYFFSQTSHESEPQRPALESAAGHLSEPTRQVWCPEVFRFSGRQPTWSHGFLAQFGDESSPGKPNVEVFGHDGKLVSAARIWFPEALEIRLFDASPSAAGGVIASGQADTTDGSSFFLAKTDNSGATVSVTRTQTFTVGRVCEGSDSSVWALGRSLSKESGDGTDDPLVQQYSFEKGLLQSYLSRKQLGLRSNAVGGSGLNGSFLVCGKDHIAIYLNETNEYMQIDPATQEVNRWKMDMSPLPQARVTGLAVTEYGGVYASLYEVEAESGKKTRGLFELRAESGKPTAQWIAVRGTLNSHREGETITKDTFWRLWGSEHDELIIGRQYDAEFSWVRVIQ